jgi:hypothetical protein
MAGWHKITGRELMKFVRRSLRNNVTRVCGFEFKAWGIYGAKNYRKTTQKRDFIS